SIHQKINKNRMGRDFIIGDIHGHKKRLFKALESVNFDESKDRLFALGDLIDRGKNSLAVLTMLYEKPWFYSIRGNHEQMLIERFDLPFAKPLYMSAVRTQSDAIKDHRNNGGKWFDKLSSEVAKQRIHQNLSQLPYAITLETELGEIGLVHAEVPGRFDSWAAFIDGLIQNKKVQEEAIWNRLAIESVWSVERDCYWVPEFQDEPKFVKEVIATVHGHTPVKTPVIWGNQVWIDTGHLGEALTIVQAEDILGLFNNENCTY
ncbi:MAG: metallophosphoesterase, partial [Hydrogenovibrio crunogenus]|nr:metallophosphoesterase [Hydrogenovibrio crunogenus]